MSSHVRVQTPERLEYLASYRLSAVGQFAPDSMHPVTNSLVTFTATTPSESGRLAAVFTAEAARSTAAFLLSYRYHHLNRTAGAEVPTAVDVQLAAPTSRTRLTSFWDLGHGGLRLRFRARAPFALELDVPAPAAPRPLTGPLAESMA